MMPSGPVLQTERLWLRPPCEEDFEAWAAVAQDETVCRFIGGVQTRAVAWRGLATMAGSWALKGFGMFSVLDRHDGRWLGRVGPWCPEGWPGTEVGWTLIREAWGRGIAAEAATATIDWAFEHLGWHEVIHTIDPANLASSRLAQRLGSQQRGPGRLPPPMAHFDVVLWGQTRAQWRSRGTE